MKIKRRFGGSILFLGLVLVLAACGDPTATPTAIPLPPTVTSAPATTRVAQAVQTTVSATTRAAQTTQSARTQSTATVAQAESDLTAVKPEKAVVKTFTDAQGRTVRLLYGRGNGRGGDYGWAHILGKHINGIWYDGGTITTFPKAVGSKSPEEVVNLIGKSLLDKNPDDQGGGRRTYSYPVPNTNKDVFTVVGNDGTIITSYPVAHGSKDEDS